MMPIQDLINQIRWDESFARGYFVVGYYDRVNDEIVHVPLQEIQFSSGNHYFFRFIDVEGHTREVPFHRIREVYKNGELIWHRKQQAPRQ